jgi:hypothetical protein
MRDRNGGHFDVGILIDQPRLHIVRLNGHTSLIALLQTLGPNVDVDLPREHDVLRHRLDTLGTVNPKRFMPALHPGREDQIWIADGVVGMQMSDECGL